VAELTTDNARLKSDAEAVNAVSALEPLTPNP